MMRFKLKIEHTGYWFWVIVYDDLEAMVAASREHDRIAGVDNGSAEYYHPGVQGVTHRFERFREGKDYPNIGIIRLARTHLTTQIVTHELVHAVLWGFRLKYNTASTGRSKWSMSWREEKLAYMYGDTLRVLTRLMYKKGLWS